MLCNYLYLEMVYLGRCPRYTCSSRCNWTVRSDLLVMLLQFPKVEKPVCKSVRKRRRKLLNPLQLLSLGRNGKKVVAQEIQKRRDQIGAIRALSSSDMIPT